MKFFIPFLDKSLTFSFFFSFYSEATQVVTMTSEDILRRHLSDVIGSYLSDVIGSYLSDVIGRPTTSDDVVELR